MLRSTSYGSRLLYHRFISPTSSPNLSDTSDSTTCRSPSPVPVVLPTQPCYQWDLKTTCQPMIPAFQYISQKLAEHGLQITLLISEQAPFLIPVWPMSRKSQLTLVKIVRKARSKFKIGPAWMNALADLSKNDLDHTFDLYRPDSYIVKRSLLQQEIVFAADGFTLMSMDHIFTLKQTLRILTEKEWIPHSRDACLSSCAALLQRIQNIHDGTPFTKGYMQRVYLEVPFQEVAFDEVVAEYDRTFCTASIRDLSSDLDFMTFYDSPKKFDSYTDAFSPVVELPDTAISHELISAVSGDNPHQFPLWPSVPMAEVERVSHITVSLPWLQESLASPIAAQDEQVWHRLDSITPTSTEGFCVPEAPPSPLKISKRETIPAHTPEMSFEVISYEPSVDLSPAGRNERMDQSSMYSEQTVSNEADRLSFRGLEELEAELCKAEQQETTRKIVEAWSKGVEKSVCARCCDVICTEGIQPARRVTICY